MGGGGNMGNMSGMPMNAMNLPMNSPGQGGRGFGFGFDSNVPTPNPGGMGMNPSRGAMGLGMNMNQAGMGGVGMGGGMGGMVPQAAGFGGQGGMGFNQPAAWMVGPAEYEGQQYMGGMWDGSEGDIPMRMGMGMGPWGGGY